MADRGKSDSPFDLRYVDRPEVVETFADSLEFMFFDGGGLRMEFVVNRWDEPKPPKKPSGRKYPVCRLVLTTNGALEFYNKLNGLFDALEKQGSIKRGVPTPPTPPTIQ